MERWLAKLIALVVVFVIIFGMTLLPIKVSALFVKLGTKGERFVSYMMCFGGGVFLGVYMLHLTPDVRRILDEALMSPKHITYPLPELIIASGFFMMVYLENLVNYCRDRSRKTIRRARYRLPHTVLLVPDEKAAGRMSSYDPTPLRIGDPTPQPVGVPTLLRDGDPTPLMICNDSQKLSTPVGNFSIVNRDRPYSLVTGNSLDENGDENDGIQNGGVKFQNGDDDGIERQRENGNASNASHATDDHAIGGHANVTRSLIFLLALSLHHVFEGLSIGLKKSVSSVWSLCVAIIAHEVVIAFSLGMQLVKTYGGGKTKVILSGLLCSGMVPLGMLIGVILTESGRQQTSSMLVINGVLQGLATGVFIYVTFFEILQEELGHGKRTGFKKLFFMLLGFVVLALLALIPEGNERYNDMSGLPNNYSNESMH